jgi:hypothetical protein
VLPQTRAQLLAAAGYFGASQGAAAGQGSAAQGGFGSRQIVGIWATFKLTVMLNAVKHLCRTVGMQSKRCGRDASLRSA